MERILKSFKDLYTGENILKKHLMFVLLLLLPAISGGVLGIIDKDTPKNVIIIMAIIGVVLLILSIVPYIYLLGFYVNFVKDRLKGISGIPLITSETFMMGVRVLPLTIVWFIYSILFFGTLMFGPIVPLVMAAMSSKPDAGAIIGLVILLLVAYSVVFVSFILIVPFASYIYFEYVDNGRALGKLFNPLILVNYMKKAFKDTIFVELKFILVSMVAGCISGVVTIIVVLASILVGGFTVLAVPESQADTAIYSIVPLVLLILLSSIATIAQIYVTSMVGYAAADNYLDIYKEKIAQNIFGE